MHMIMLVEISLASNLALGHRPVTSFALHLGFEVTAVTEENEIGHSIDPDPFNRLAAAMDAGKFFDAAIIGLYGFMARHAAIDIRQTCALLCPRLRVAEETRRPVRDMTLVAERHGLGADLLGKNLLLAFVPRPLLSRQQWTGQGKNKAKTE